MNFQLRHCSIWSCLGLPCAAFPTRPRALHTLILFNFLFYFQKLFVYFSLSLSTAFAATFSTRPCALHTPFFSSQLSFATKTSCSLVTLFLLFCTFPDIHHNCFKFIFFITCMPPFWHFIEQMYMSTQIWWFTRFVATFFVLYLFLILYA